MRQRQELEPSDIDLLHNEIHRAAAISVALAMMAAADTFPRGQEYASQASVARFLNTLDEHGFVVVKKEVL